jgi:hypothetical protein
VSNVTGLPDGYALRLLVDPAEQRVDVPESAAFAGISLALPA